MMSFSLLSSFSSSPSAMSRVAPEGPTQKLSPLPASWRSAVRQSVPSCASRTVTTAWNCSSFAFAFPISRAVVTDLPNSGLSSGPMRAIGSDTSTIMGASAGIHCTMGGKSSPRIEEATNNRDRREAGIARALRNIFLLIIRSCTPQSYKEMSLSKWVKALAILADPEQGPPSAWPFLICGFSKLDSINGVSHGRRIEAMVYRVPGVTAEPLRAENVIPFLRLETGRALPGLARIPGHENTVVAHDHHVFLVAAEERTLPDIDRRSLGLPTRASILADEQAGHGPQVMCPMKKDRNPGLWIRRRDYGPSNAGICAPMDAVALAVNESRRIQGTDHRDAVPVFAEVDR